MVGKTTYVLAIDTTMFKLPGDLVNPRTLQGAKWERSSCGIDEFFWARDGDYPLVNIQKTMENHHL